MYFRHCLQTFAIIYVWKDSCSFPEFEKVNVKIWLGLKWCAEKTVHFFCNFSPDLTQGYWRHGKSGRLLSASCKSSFITAHSLKPRPPVSIQIYAFLPSKHVYDPKLTKEPRTILFFLAFLMLFFFRFPLLVAHSLRLCKLVSKTFLMKPQLQN